MLNYVTEDDPLLEDYTFVEDITHQINSFNLNFCPFKLRQSFLSDPYLSQFAESFDFENITKNFIFMEEKGGHQVFKSHANRVAVAFKFYSKVMHKIHLQLNHKNAAQKNPHVNRITT